MKDDSPAKQSGKTPNAKQPATKTAPADGAK
jgi:hypothetical protein